ncbi:MAG TPA: rhodanese-like domain-containing protein [Telluria sp.]
MRYADNRGRRAPWMALALALALAGSGALAAEVSALPASKQTVAGRYLDARQAYDLKQKLGGQAFLLDVRTRYEVMYVGTPTLTDANIPYMEHPDGAQWDDKAGRFRMELNSDFGAELARRLQARGLGKDSTVILICRSGDRSARAANLLTQLGYSAVYSVTDGFEGDAAPAGEKQGQRVVNGWKNAGLPWTYKLDKERVYLPKN